MKNILWDFDGVILDSMKIRDFGFKQIFSSYNSDKVSQLIKYHQENGGLSRYVKIRYFFEEILKEDISEKELTRYTNEFSDIMRSLLVDPNNLIENSLTYIINNYQKYNFHIVSGSDQSELRFLCNKLQIDQYFLSIHGSPKPKDYLINKVLVENNYDKSETILIGDSINDYEASKKNKISFMGYNNERIEKLSDIRPLF